MVKLLLLLLMSLSLQAETLISITNSEGQPMSKDFATEVEADEYIAKHGHTWGKLAGWRKDNCTGQTGTRFDVFGEVEYNCPDNFTVIKSDNTASAILKALEIDLANDISFGKALIKKIRLMSRSNGNNVAKRISLRNTFAPIFLSFENGDNCAGRSQVDSINGNADVSAPQKAAIIAAIDAYKTCP